MRLTSNPFRKSDILFFVLAGLLVAAHVLYAGDGFPLDDSWIHQVYARNLALRGEWAFVPGQPSAASTSPLYTVLLATGYALGVNYPLWAHLVGTLSLAGAGMLAARMAQHLSPKSRLIGMAAGLAMITAWHHIWAAASGMETMVFSVLTLVLIGLAWREVEADHSVYRYVVMRGAVFGAAAALATLARPEGFMLAGIIGLMMLLARPQGSWRAFWLWVSGAVVGFGLLIAPYLLLNLQLTGGLLPSTAAAKQEQNAYIVAQVDFLTRFWKMIEPLTAGGQVFLLPGVIISTAYLIRHGGRNRLLYLVPVLWSVGLAALYAARLPAPFQHGRYLIPALPTFILMGVVGTAMILNWGKRSLVGRVLARTLALSTIVTFAGFAILISPGVYRTDVRIIEEEMVTAAHWIADNLPPDELLVIHDIGAVGYFAPRPILDIAGLVTPEVIPIITDGDALWRLMRERDGRYLMAFPDQIPNDNPDDPRLCEVYNTRGETSRKQGGPNMAIYRLAWEGDCEGQE